MKVLVAILPLLLAVGCHNPSTTNSVTGTTHRETISWSKMEELIETLKAAHPDAEVCKINVAGSKERDEVICCSVCMSSQACEKQYLIDHNGITEQ